MHYYSYINIIYIMPCIQRYSIFKTFETFETRWIYEYYLFTHLFIYKFKRVYVLRKIKEKSVYSKMKCTTKGRKPFAGKFELFIVLREKLLCFRLFASVLYLLTSGFNKRIRRKKDKSSSGHFLKLFYYCWPRQALYSDIWFTQG